MKSTIKQLCTIFALACATSLALFGCSKDSKATASCAGDEWGCAHFKRGAAIRIGYAGPMTGDSSAFGIDISQGGKIAIADINQNPLHGWKFELATQDTVGTPEGGAAVANLYVSDPTVVAIAGDTFSGSTEAAIPIYEAAGYPMLSPSATNPSLTKMGSKVFNRLPFTDDEQGTEAAAYLFKKCGSRRIAVIHDGSAYGQGLAHVLRDQFKALGGEVVAYEAITPGETDYSAPLSAVAALNPEALFFGGYGPEAAVIVSQMATAGMKKTIFFSDDGIFGANFIRLAGRAAEGGYATSIVPPASSARKAFDEKYKALYGVEPGTLTAFTWNGYDSVAALAHAIRNVAYVENDELHIPRGALVKAVRTLRDFQGLSGTITCDEFGECNTSGPTFYRVSNGKWVEAE